MEKRSNNRGEAKKTRKEGSFSKAPSKSFSSSKESRFGKSSDSPKKSYSSKESGVGDIYPRPNDRPKRPFGEKREFGSKPYGNRPQGGNRFLSNDDRPKRPFGEKREFGSKPYGDRPQRSFDGNSSDRPQRSYGERSQGDDRPKRSFGEKREFGSKPYGDRPQRSFDGNSSDRPQRSYGERSQGDDRLKKPFGEKREFGSKPYGDRPARSFDGNSSDRPQRSYGERSQGDDRPKRPFGEKREFGSKPYGDRPARSFDGNSSDRPQRSYGERSQGDDRPKRPFGEKREFGSKPYGDRPQRSFDGNSSDRPQRSYGERSQGDDRPKRPFGEKREFGSKPYDDRPKRSFDNDSAEKPKRTYGKREDESSSFSRTDERPKRTFGKREESSDRPERKKNFGDNRADNNERSPRYDKERMISAVPEKRRKFIKEDEDEEIRLNRYIANAGICSRRDADELIATGQIKVNGTVITEMGYKVKPSDSIKYGNKLLNREKPIYLLLNKPKDYITTTDDPNERHTVMDLIAGAGSQRIYPVGRLDRNTTGLLLLTNDGELAEKLTHPSNEIRKIYQAELDKPITTEDFEAIQKGVELEDGLIKPDEIAIITPDAQVIGIEIHSGKNRIVRRIFEHFGYEVMKLDRTTYAGLTKKELPRGKWRFLSEKEVIRLKYMI